MENALLILLGYLSIWIATGLKRDISSKIKMFEKTWWIQVALISIGGILLRYAQSLSN